MAVSLLLKVIESCQAALDVQRMEPNAFQGKVDRLLLKMPVRLGPMRKIAKGAGNWRQSRICYCQRVRDNAFHLVDEEFAPRRCFPLS